MPFNLGRVGSLSKSKTTSGYASGNAEATGATVASTAYALRAKELITLNRDLRALGAQLLFDLPEIAVIGAQSAGKSSLIEAVSGVSPPPCLPTPALVSNIRRSMSRDSGTCTRCPTECTMSSDADTWSCVITLETHYDSDGNPLPTSLSRIFGSTLFNKDDVELWLRRAQAATLNPDQPIETFYTKSAAQIRESPRLLEFSENTIHVLIRDKEAMDLCFIDLPGLIQSSSQNVIDFVKDLVVSKIAEENTLILIAIPMGEDMDNQQALLLAKEADPEGERTIGILIKPDKVGTGDTGLQNTWTRVLLGQEHPLKHGYYCVRLPDDHERARRLSRSQSEFSSRS